MTPLRCAACDAELREGDALVEISPGIADRYATPTGDKLRAYPSNDAATPLVVCAGHLEDVLDDIRRRDPLHCDHRWSAGRSYDDSPTFYRCYDCGAEAER